MKQQLRVRFWIEVVIATVNIGLLASTLLWHDWIELVFHIDPDGGSGALEWWIVAVTLTVSLVCFILMRIEWRRLARRSA